MSMRKKKEPDLEAELANEFELWEHLREHGGNDPFYDDATNMNLVRNHIFYWKRQIEEKYGAERECYPEIYFRETPPEVMAGYMADAAEIRDRAAETLDRYLADDGFRYLLCNKGMLTEKEAKEINVDNVLGYVSGLADALKKDNLVTMRRHIFRPENYLESLTGCAEKMKRIIDQKSAMSSGCNQQMTLFHAGLEYGKPR